MQPHEHVSHGDSSPSTVVCNGRNDTATPFVSPAETAVLAFTLSYMAVWLTICLFIRNSEFILYFLVMCTLLSTITAVHIRMRLHIAALWGLSIWGLLHMAGGLLPIPASWPAEGSSVLYNWWLIPELLKYDQAVHAYGFGLVTWIFWQLIHRTFARLGVVAKPSLGLLTMCVAASMGFGALNELIEFVASLTLGETNVGGYENTGWDLVANFAGCIFAAIFVRLKSKQGSEDDTST